MKRFFLFILICLNVSHINLFGQLVVNTTQTPEQLVQNFLIKGELSISNVTFKGITGTDGQIGSFTGGNTTNLGITEGIVMASGFVKNVPGAYSNTIADYPDSEGDADLQALIGKESRQAAVLEFDFMPTANTVKFRYVFASEEYNEWVCSSYNDVFGFFLSGPGINGSI